MKNRTADNFWLETLSFICPHKVGSREIHALYAVLFAVLPLLVCIGYFSIWTVAGCDFPSAAFYYFYLLFRIFFSPVKHTRYLPFIFRDPFGLRLLCRSH